MSSTIELTTKIDVQGNASILFGDKQNPALVLINTGQVVQANKISIPDGYTVVTLWATGGAGIQDFQWGVIFSDQDILVQLKNSLGTAEYELQSVSANVPFYFGYTMRGRTSNSLTTNVQTTGLGNIVEIKVQRNVAAAVGAANVTMFLFR